MTLVWQRQNEDCCKEKVERRLFQSPDVQHAESEASTSGISSFALDAKNRTALKKKKKKEYRKDDGDRQVDAAAVANGLGTSKRESSAHKGKSRRDSERYMKKSNSESKGHHGDGRSQVMAKAEGAPRCFRNSEAAKNESLPVQTRSMGADRMRMSYVHSENSVGIPNGQVAAHAMLHGHPVTSSLSTNDSVSYQQDMALAYRLAEQERINASMRVPTSRGQVNGYPVYSFESSQVPDMHLASALAESQFSAKQAEEISRTHAELYKKAVDKATEDSLKTVDHDSLLRDIKLWTIDLAAASDEVISALSMISKRKSDVSSKLDRAIERQDEDRVARMLWESTQLPIVEKNVQRLVDNMVPIGVAVNDLQDLRQGLLSEKYTVFQAENERDRVIEKLFKALKNIRVKDLPSSGGLIASEDCQDSADLRDFVSLLIENAKKMPRIPPEVFNTAQEMIQGAQSTKTTNSSLEKQEKRQRKKEKSRATEVAPEEINRAVKGRDSGQASDARGSSSMTAEKVSLINTASASENLTKIPGTIPEPFDLSQSIKSTIKKSNDAEEPLPIRRVPAFFTLHHEMVSDRGVVYHAVEWESREYQVDNMGNDFHLVPAPVNVDEFYSKDINELTQYVQKHVRSFGKKPKSSVSTDSFENNEKWYTMCEAANAILALKGASKSFLSWKIKKDESIQECCHRLKALVSQTLSVIAEVAYSTENLMVSLKKYDLPWDDGLVTQVRWDAQHAAAVVMQYALACAEDAGRYVAPTLY